MLMSRTPIHQPAELAHSRAMFYRYDMNESDSPPFQDDTISTFAGQVRVSLRDGRFYITTITGLEYVACQAYIGDEDTMKFVGGRNGYTIKYDRYGKELHISLAALAEACGVPAGVASEHAE